MSFVLWFKYPKEKTETHHIHILKEEFNEAVRYKKVDKHKNGRASAWSY